MVREWASGKSPGSLTPHESPGQSGARSTRDLLFRHAIRHFHIVHHNDAFWQECCNDACLLHFVDVSHGKN